MEAIVLFKLFVLLKLFVFILGNDSVSVNIKLGQINGKKEIIDGREINTYLGIPYAEPPVKDLRFKKPLPVKQWSEPIDATHWSGPCYQEAFFPMHNKNYTEDCLHLNIWSPVSNDKNELKPVMFAIHGGAFIRGSSSQIRLNGEVLASRGDVVVVSFNYRYAIKTYVYFVCDSKLFISFRICYYCKCMDFFT